MRPKNTPRFISCAHCGRDVRIYPSQIGRKRYCSDACRRANDRAGVISRFWSKVDKSGGPNSCWVWLAGRSTDGYGQFSFIGVRQNAHRKAWELTNGPIPNGMLVCHKCDNPPCCNPGHLFIGTNADNMQDMNTKGRHPRNAAWNPVGEDNPKSKLTDEAVIEARRRWAVGGVSKSQLARDFGVSSTMMSWIILQKFWKHLPSAEELREESH